ncbi:MAG: HAMP domain-containing sensor histidine kinase [Phormidesmis sp.]
MCATEQKNTVQKNTVQKSTVQKSTVPRIILKSLNLAEIQYVFDELQQQIEQLREKNQMLLKTRATELHQIELTHVKDDFISIISHELRTPLTAIHGGVKLLSQGYISSETEQGQQLIQIIAQNSQRLVRLVNDILDIEYLTAAKDPLCKHAVNTQDITGPVTATFGPIADRTRIELMVSDPGFEIVCDRDRIVQVLTNLLDNAYKFSPPHSTVRLTVGLGELPLKKTSDSSEAVILFKVYDQGTGISPEHCAQIFDRFVQVDSSNTRQKGGIGLGLAICRSIVEWHGGHIWGESIAGEGSCFAFTLPVG